MNFDQSQLDFLRNSVIAFCSLVWLQMQTVQNEIAKEAKARLQTAPSSIRTLKSPGKALLSPLPNKQMVPQESVTKLLTCYSGHRVNPYWEES